jgi:hypothetical protein
MSRPLVERRLSDVASRLKKLREDLRVAQEQYRHFEEESQDARLRALVSETKLDEREGRDAARAAEAMARHRDDLVAEIERLERTQDELLDQMLAAGEGS